MCLNAYAAWQPIGPEGGPLREIAVAPSDNAVLYTVSNHSEAQIYKSVDGAMSWSSGGVLSGWVYSIAVDPTDPDVVYAGGMGMVYKTTNGGASWTFHTFPGNIANDITIDPSNPNVLYAATSYQQGSVNVMACCKSTNGGLNWSVTTLNSFSGGGNALDIDPGDHLTVYIGGYYKDSLSQTVCTVYKSTNGGVSFVEMNNGIPSSAYWVSALAVHETNSNIVYAATYYNGIYRTTNGGSSWNQVNTGLLMFTLVTSPADPNIAYAGADTLIYKTTNSGASWFIAGYGYGAAYKNSRGLAVTQNISCDNVYTADIMGCYRSSNGGSSWVQATNGILMAMISCMEIAPSSPSTMYTYDANLGIFKTFDNGMNWTKLEAPASCGSMVDLAVHNTNPNLVFGCEGSG